MNIWQEWICSQVLPTLSASCFSSSCVSIWSSKWGNSILSGRLSRRNKWKGIKRLKIVSIWRNMRTQSSNLRSGTLKTLQTLSNKSKTQNFSQSTRTCWKYTDQTQWTRSSIVSILLVDNQLRVVATLLTDLWSISLTSSWMTLIKRSSTIKSASLTLKSRIMSVSFGHRPFYTQFLASLRCLIST